uniref:Uncharacterized protein n=1 Tax=Solanum tuberosum TaxID=4113 RepID=M1DMV3_SOLTU
MSSPQSPKASSRGLPRSVVHTTSRGGAREGEANTLGKVALPPLRPRDLHAQLYGPSRAPLVVVVPVVFGAVSSQLGTALAFWLRLARFGLAPCLAPSTNLE